MQDAIVASLLFAALLQAIMAVYAWSRRKEPTAKPLLYAAMIFIVWSFTYGMDLASDRVAEKVLWMRISDSFTIFISLATLLLVLEHLGLAHHITRQRRAALLFVPMLTIVLIWTGPYYSLFRYDFLVIQVGALPILTWKSGPLLWLAQIYANALIVISIYLLMHSLTGASQIKRGQKLLILTALVVPLGVETLYHFDLSPIPGYNLTPQVLIPTWLLLAYAIFRYRWLDLVPLARSTLIDILPTGMIVLDAQERLLDMNSAAQRVLNISASAIGQDVHQALAHLGTTILQQVDVNQTRQEIQIRSMQGGTEYYEVEIVPIQGKSSRSPARIVMFYNVTERKLKELRLLPLSEAVDQSPTSVVITDLKGIIEYVNPRFSTLTGYTPQEAIGQSTNLVKSGHTPAEVYQEMWQTIESGQIWRGEFLNKKKNGEFYWEQAVIAPVKNADGRIINFIAIKEDISAQKAAAEALQRSESELREINALLEERIATIAALEAELREQAIRDPLTNLYNRRYLKDFLERELLRVKRSGHPLSVIIMDIDHFKNINDTYGHQIGDEILQLLAELLQEHARKFDIACRFGGEEFLLVLPETDLEIAMRRAEELREIFAHATVSSEGQEIRVTMSLGLATFPLHGNTAAALIQMADKALYASKRGGRNRVTAWKSNLDSLDSSPAH